jgi:cell wall-associated NlpC family hydrolase
VRESRHDYVAIATSVQGFFHNSDEFDATFGRRMSNTRSSQLRPSVSLLALLVVALMIVAAPASAGWKKHRAPAIEPAVIALQGTNRQAIEAARLERELQQRLRTVRTERGQAVTAERAARAEVVATGPGLAADAAERLVAATRARIALQRTERAVRADLAHARTLAAKAEARRAVVLGRLSSEERRLVLRLDRKRQLQARARRAIVRQRTLLAAPDLQPAVAAGVPASALAERLAAPPAPAPASAVGAIAAAYAVTQLGAPYRTAGYSPQTGFDCSGLLYWAFAQAGLDVPRSSWQIWAAGRRVTRAAAQPGDLVSFHGQGHIGFYLGRGLYVHSTRSGDVVSVHAIADRTDLDGFVRVG